VNSQNSALADVRVNAGRLLKAIGIKRIVVVDDEYYAEEAGSVEDLLGLCVELDPTQALSLPSLGDVPFDADYGVWSGILLKKWESMMPDLRLNVLRHARKLVGTGQENPTDVVLSDPGGDARVARSLFELLSDLQECSFVTLSLGRWRRDREEYLGDPVAALETLFLFDRDFRRENASADEGLVLVREVQGRGVAICGLITHTVNLGAEHAAWNELAGEHGLDRNRFVVIAKQRLAEDGGAEPYSFLRMVRLAALSSRCASMKKAAWKIFEDSVAAAREVMERVSVLDFDQIVLASSRREGVWEPDTLFRVFSVFMRQEARRRLHEDSDAGIPAKVEEARRISSIPVEAEAVIGREPPCAEAIRVHRFELFESGEILNGHHLPIDLGDILEDSKGQRFILLAQPCDLMVRPNGRRAYDDKCTRQVALAELTVKANPQEIKQGRAEIAWYVETTGASGYVDFAKSHDVRLAILDLCVLTADGSAAIDVQGECPVGLIEPWLKHFEGLKKLFSGALQGYYDLEKKNVAAKLKKLALPAASLSAKFEVHVDGKVVKYDVRRVGRLNQPRAGALLTSFAQYRSRAAFEHDLDHRSPLNASGNEDDDVEHGCQGDTAEANDKAKS
jgi:hypothetical protein